jgi:hypothetical protein
MRKRPKPSKKEDDFKIRVKIPSDDVLIPTGYCTSASCGRTIRKMIPKTPDDGS